MFLSSPEGFLSLRILLSPEKIFIPSASITTGFPVSAAASRTSLSISFAVSPVPVPGPIAAAVHHSTAFLIFSLKAVPTTSNFSKPSLIVEPSSFFAPSLFSSSSSLS